MGHISTNDNCVLNFEENLEVK